MRLKLNIQERTALKKICDNVIKLENNNYELQIAFLFKNFFNPQVHRKKIYENIVLLKIEMYIEPQIIEHLQQIGLVEYICEKNIVIPTPLGILFNKYEGRIPEMVLISLIDQYHNKLSYKLKSAVKYFGKTKILSISELAPIVFLLYNNNISKQQGLFKIHDIKLKESIDRIISAFATRDSKSQGTKERNGSLSGWYLTEANRKLGLPIHNQKQYYYIKPDFIHEVEKAIKISIAKNPIETREAFKAFEEAFFRESKTLFEKGALYSTINSKEKVKKLFMEDHY